MRMRSWSRTWPGVVCLCIQCAVHACTWYNSPYSYL
jgi:hypothetical protein